MQEENTDNSIPGMGSDKEEMKNLPVRSSYCIYFMWFFLFLTSLVFLSLGYGEKNQMQFSMVRYLSLLPVFDGVISVFIACFRRCDIRRCCPGGTLILFLLHY